MTGLLFGLLLAVLLVGWYSFERQKETYGQLVAILARDRDEAKAELTAFRKVLFPGLARFDVKSEPHIDVPAAQPTPLAAGKTAGTSTKAPLTGNPLMNKRVPFRVRFNSARKLFNTGQRNTDALASALQQQKHKPLEEKANVSS